LLPLACLVLLLLLLLLLLGAAIRVLPRADFGSGQSDGNGERK
jgi:hypothetical protein